MIKFDKEIVNTFKNFKIEIPLYPEEVKRKFISITSFYSFILKEWEFWQDVNQGTAQNIFNSFNSMKSYLDKLGDQNTSIESKNNDLDAALRIAHQNSMYCLFSVTAAGQKMKILYEHSPISANAFCDYLLGNGFNGEELSNANYLYGAIESINFFNSNLNSDETLKINNNLLKELSNKYATDLDDLNNEAQDFKSNISSWKQILISNLENTVREQETKLSALIQTYEEHLRLEQPAEYWDKLCQYYEDRGKYWRKWSLIISSCSAILLTLIFFNLPSELTDSKFLSFSSFKSILVLTVIISICIYLLRLFIKLTTSSYHLSRDAKERYQLTYFYLSLIKDRSITESERSIVYNSLFSRADTGLLKGDSSPTLPDGMMQQILKMIRQ